MDSTAETVKHMRMVQALLGTVCTELLQRGAVHDNSKLESPEKEGFDQFTEELSSLTYDSPEYRESLKKLGEVLDHHYAKNSHHPQHHREGVNGMTLLDVVEMFCDWKAATMRHDDGNLGKSIIQNQVRFNLSPQLASIFENTRRELGW